MFSNAQRGSTSNSAAPPSSARRGTRPQPGRTASPGPSQQPGGSLFSTSTQRQSAYRDNLFPGGGGQSSQQQQRRADPGVGIGGGALDDEDEDLNALSDAQIHEINEAFQLFDQNRDNRIDFHELKVAAKALGFDLGKPELLDLLRIHGVLASGSPPTTSTPASALFITRDSFRDIMAEMMKNRDPNEEINRAFDLFTAGAQPDSRGVVKIGVEELMRVARELQEPLGEEELRAMIDEFDVDNDGMSRFHLRRIEAFG
ncbi:EF-hand [Ascodesmis nigricans]|uniref:EF-hand n=1 Tax=Ascodesmis nigricans TaxID=341454 RepID=A0A4S2N6R5_9PEZI|nr:EF-hand [Ascodesmis nigricans]